MRLSLSLLILITLCLSGCVGPGFNAAGTGTTSSFYPAVDVGKGKYRD